MPGLPTGTVTFLLTDIEGSTRLWEAHPDAMGAVVARHDALLTEAIRAHGGVIIRTRGEGDSFFAVFDRATDAVAAARDLQRALFAEPWEIPIRVRVGINTGEAELREGDYYGTAINRCARLRAIAHGGQTLLGQATYEMIQGDLPEGTSLRSLGAHRLKDLQRPEQVYQLLHPDLPSEFPPLNSLEARPNNLPQQVTSFIGREREMAEVKRLLETTRLLTLTGPGGTGKTRLALQVAADLIDPFENGVFFVDLAPITAPNLVLSTIAGTLGVREREGRPLVEGLKEHLHGKQVLLILDNFEQVVAAAPQVADLLASCAGLKILVTSRAVLHVRGEQEFPVPPLAVPTDGREGLPLAATVDASALSPPPRPTGLPLELEAGAPASPTAKEEPVADASGIPSPNTLAQYASVQLFIDRARSARPSFAITAENAAAVAEICRRLDGLPLAIELAAARVKVLSPQAMLSRLSRRLPLLTGGARDLPERHQSLRGAIAWSYDLLDARQQRLFRRLCVFVGGFTLAAAEAVCADLEEGPEAIPAYEVLDGVAALVDNSLLRQSGETEAEEPRFSMLETIREFAWEKLRESGEEELLRRRHRDWYLALVEEADAALGGAAQGEWLERLETEHDNLRAALGWSIEREEIEPGLRLGGALWRFWAARGHLTEGRERLSELLLLVERHAVSHQRPDLAALHARALHGAGLLAGWQGDYASARSLCQESLKIRLELEDQQGTADSLNNLGSIAAEQGDYAAARSLYEESLAIRRRLGDRRGIALSLHHLGELALDQGDLEGARALHEESLAIRRCLDDPPAVADSLNCLGIIAYLQGDYAAARRLYEESLAIRRKLGIKRGIAGSLANLGIVAHALGDFDQAARLYEESRSIQLELGDRPGLAVSLLHLGIVALHQGLDAQAARLFRESIGLFQALHNSVGIVECLHELAAGAAARGQWERAVKLWAATRALRESAGAPSLPADLAEQEQKEAARRALGEEGFAAAWAAGEAMSLEAAVACALEVVAT